MNAIFYSREFKDWSTVRGASWLWRAIFNWRTARRAVLGLAALITLIAIFYAVENVRGNRAWEQLKREMAANGEPLDIAALIPPTVPDAENFAMAPLWRGLLGNDYRDAKVASTAWLHVRTENNYRPDLPFGHWRMGERTDLASWQAYFRAVQANVSGPGDTDVFPLPAQPGNPAEDVLLALSRFDRQLAELREAARRPRSRFPLHYEVGMNMTMPHLSYLQSATVVLCLRTLAELELGRAEDALADLQLGFRLMKAVESEPVLFSFLVRLSMLDTMLPTIWQGTAEHRWNDAQLATLDESLGKLDFLADSERGFRAEAVWGAETYDSLKATRREKSLFIFGLIDFKGRWKTVFRWMPSGWFAQNKVLHVRQMRELTLMRARPAAEYVDLARWKALLAKMDADTNALTPYNFIVVWIGGYGEISVRTLETTAHIRLARTALALERHRLAHGEFPESLKALAPSFIAAVPRDVIDGGELKYRRGADGGIVLYSLGWNGVDDGGSVGLLRRNRFDRKLGDWVWQFPSR